MKIPFEPAQTLFVVDVSSFIYRAYFAIRNLKNRQGQATNAVYGVATMLARLAEDASPDFLAIAYDSKEPSFRKEVYSEYKANRSAPPDDLIPQFDWIEQLIRCMGFPTFRQSGVEADDLIATLTRRWLALSDHNRVVIVSGDKDLMQLVDDRVRVWDTMADRLYGSSEVVEKFGVTPGTIRDYLSLVGDSSDNIPGVAGIGPKTAVDLLGQHGSLEGVLSAAMAGKVPGKKGETLKLEADLARLSAKLVTLHDDCPLDLSPERVKYHFHVTQDCADLLISLDFKSLLKKWLPEDSSIVIGEPSGGAPLESAGIPLPLAASSVGAAVEQAPVVTLVAEPGCFRTVNTEEDFRKLLAASTRRGEFAIDVETTSLNPRMAELVGVSIAHDFSNGYYIPVGHRGTNETQLPLGLVLEGLKPLLENPRLKKVGQNLKYDWSVFRQLGINAAGIGADTMVAGYVLDPEGRHNLETLAARYLGYTVTTYEQVVGKGGKGSDPLGFDQVDIATATRYSGEDAWVSLHLWETLRKKLDTEHLMEIFARVDMPLVNVLSRMECQGVCIDEPWLKNLSREFERELLAIEQRIQAFGRGGALNLNSTKQLAQLLFDELKLPPQGKTKTGYSTDASVLEALAPLHEVPKLLLEFREISKLKGTYVDPLPLLKDPKTGKIHASFHQAVTATGRLSSSDPNLQNIPIRTERGRLIRRAFIPSGGNVLIAADYSQIELRLLAHVSGDPELVSAFRDRNEDVHRRTAAEIYGVAPDAVTDRQRGVAKAINFGLMYGKTAFGLSQELKIPRKEAQEMIARYFERYSGVKRFLDQQVADARERGWATTLLGRKRYLPDIVNRNAAVRANAERMAMNAPIQGAAADLMKLAMTELDERLEKEGFSARLIIQVHDEVVLDCPKEEAEAVQKLVTDVMEHAMELSVPLVANAGSGANWMDL